jgi:hypothetical protein
MFNDKLLLVGVAALSAVATAGWVRQTPVTVAPQAFTAPMLEMDPAIAVQPVGFADPGTGVNRGVYHQTASQAGVYQQASRVSTNQPRVRARRAQNVYDDRRVYDDQPVSQKRSTAKSAAIIGGGAAAGAAVGGLAGGGKGAAIGALTGGAGGLVYDRMTRDKESTDPYRANDARYEDGRNQRSTAESAMIIGGGAAAGAAVGGIAGGGKGAAIGALGGGAAGLIYDRMTKNK